MSRGEGEVARHYVNAIVKLVIYIIVYVVVAAIVHWIITSLLPMFGINVKPYEGYVNVLLALAFGYLIVSAFADVIYWAMRFRYDHPTARAMRNVFLLIGIGALVAGIAGAIGGGVAGVAVGGFLGIVIGFAVQQVLGQAVAGLFLLLARPFKISDHVNLLGEDGIVNDVAILFTEVIKSDGTKVLIPNNSIIGNKIYLLPKQQPQQQQQK
ncbi:mechanosensitive ion channel domain-containing protein [Vulcanisaeta distributa]|uniref:MscS Mechanosensitive ion channel n=1 Tax=Vulcanisaeta distributa (strain DSM 14429 / JCM 11212 / NBRC 100878 / IC-017) TaxID=572478 RepID=E1QR95_VULDI|nr:MscS Mechanosensitive ion channel [Vulcanisaeta distributa DSM 14429]